MDVRRIDGRQEILRKRNAFAAREVLQGVKCLFLRLPIMVLNGIIRFGGDKVAHGKIVTGGNAILIAGKCFCRQVLRLSREKTQHNRCIESECHTSLPMMARNAFANGCHIVRQIRVHLYAPKPRRRLSLSCGRTPRSRSWFIAEPLRIQHKRNGPHGNPFLRRPRLNPSIHRIRNV